MKEYAIEETEHGIAVSRGNAQWNLTYDEITGDWMVADDTDELPQIRYLKNKQSAVLYAFERLGLIEDADYQVAPDRTSA